MIKLPNNLIELFDLENADENEKKAFIDNVSDLIMKSVLQKAWAVLDSDGRDTLTKLLEDSNASPDDMQKSNAVFNFLDNNLPNMEDVVRKEITLIQEKFVEIRDSIRDEVA